MERSLTVLLPVHNAQSTLTATVHEVLDVLPELARRFDVLIVDDGSTDATAEIAEELARDYPQVHVVYRGRCAGREAAIQAGLEHSSGELILVRDEDAGMSLHTAQRWWHAAAERGPIPTERAETHASPLKFVRHPRRQAGYRVLKRSASELQPASGPRSEPEPSRPGRPNYLARLRKFALDQ